MNEIHYKEFEEEAKAGKLQEPTLAYIRNYIAQQARGTKCHQVIYGRRTP